MAWKEKLAHCRELRRSASEKGSNDWVMEEIMVPGFVGQLSEQLSNTSAESTTEQLKETMNALRVVNCCLSVEETRIDVQREMVVEQTMHVSLFALLSLKKSPSKKLQTVAAQLLCNLVTGNAETASTVLTDLPLSPSEEEIEARLLEQTTSCAGEELQTGTHGWTWLDMMLNLSSSNRDALGAVVAVLYNALSVSHQWEPLDSSNWSHQVGMDCRLVATLLRHMLPSAKAAAVVENESTADSATEWISLLIEGLCRWGYLGQLLDSAVGGGANPEKTTAVLPEHLVLLHCIASSVDAWSRYGAGRVEKGAHPLGGGSGTADTLNSHLALANFALNARQAAMSLEPGMVEKDEMAPLNKCSLTLVFEILGNSLGDDSLDSLMRVREELGGSLIPILGEDLRQVVDVLTEQQQSRPGASSRELKLSSDEQHWMTTLVRLMGNLCFRCRTNQDMMRHSITDEPGFEQQQRHRTVLHILLSCTSFAYGCFTLREWAIVAIRNALEGNEANQALVEQLEAQQPLQNAELAKMGMKVEMDRKGKVRVVPTDDGQAS